MGAGQGNGFVLKHGFLLKGFREKNSPGFKKNLFQTSGGVKAWKLEESQPRSGGRRKYGGREKNAKKREAAKKEKCQQEYRED